MHCRCYFSRHGITIIKIADTPCNDSFLLDSIACFDPNVGNDAIFCTGDQTKAIWMKFLRHGRVKITEANVS